MQDKEINQAIAKIEYPNYKPSGMHFEMFDYCTNWSAMGPIVERERMKIVPLMSKWRVYKNGIYAQESRLCHAAAMCYLKAKGVEL